MIKDLNQQMAMKMYWKLINELRLNQVDSDLIDQFDLDLEDAGVVNKLLQLNDAPTGILIVNGELSPKVEKTSRD